MAAQRLTIAVVAAAVVVAGGLLAPVRATDAVADSVPRPCLEPLPPTSILNTASSGPLGNGATRLVDLPASLPSGLAAVTLQVRASGTKAGELNLGPAAASSQRVSALHVVGNKWQSSTAWVTNPGAQLAVAFASVRGSALNATIDVVGYVTAQSCFRALSPTPAVDTATGAGLAAAGALSPGSTTTVTLGGESFLPGGNGIAPVRVRLSSGAYPATVTIKNDAAPPVTVGTWRLLANSFWTGAYEFPPSLTNGYTVGVTGGPVQLSLSPLGWFADANAHAIASDLAVDTTTGLGAPKAALSSGQTVTFATPADVRQPAAVVLQVAGTAKSDASGFVWPTGAAQPRTASFQFTKNVPSVQQLVVVPATADSTFSVRIGSGTTNLSVAVVGWVPFPPPVNEPVDGVTHVTAASDVTAPVVDPTTGVATITYTGTEKLDVGDVVVQGSTSDLPDGYLGVVTNIAAPPSGTAAATLRSPSKRKALKLSAATSASTATTSTDTIVTLAQASLQDALPNADMDSATMDVDSGEPPPESSDPLPPDTPPDPDAAPTLSAATSSLSERVALAASTPTGGSLPSGGTLPCSLGTSVKVNASLKLNAGVNLTGSWRLGQGAKADFNASAGLAGSVSVNANSGLTCNARTTLPGPTLPTITFTIGPVPVVVRPVLSLDLAASGSIGAAFKASAGMNLGLAVGVKYENGTFTPYLSAKNSFPVTVDARYGASLRFEVAPRLDLKIYGVAGPYLKLAAWAKADVNVLSNPWWTAEAGVDGDVGLKLDVWLVHASFSAGIRRLATFHAGNAPGAYPGPRIATTSLPSGSVGGSYSAQLSASGGSPPFSWYRVSGSLPAGLSLAMSGAITGRPTTTQQTSFTVRLIDGAGYRSPTDMTLSITVAAGPSIVTTSLPGGQVGTGYSAGLQATGGAAPYTWSLAGGSLPPGIGLAPNGTISGTPSTAGTYSFSVRVVDSNGAPSPSNANLTISIAGTTQPPPPSQGVAVSWGARAPSSYCGGDTSCTYVTITWSNFSTGNHTITPYFDGQGNWCGSAGCANSLVRSGSSGSLTGYWAAGYCRQSHVVTATVDGIRSSNSINTIDHGC